MTTDKELLSAIEDMRCGKQNGFLVFYNKTFQFTFLWANRHFADSDKRNRFLAEFYPYILLHISELKEDNRIFSWLEEVLPLFYLLHTGESHLPDSLDVSASLPDDSAILAAASIIWSQITKAVSFPEKEKHHGIILPIVFAGSLAVLLLLLGILSLGNDRMSREEIDQINEENLLSTPDTELEDYLNHTAKDAAVDVNAAASSASTTVTDIDHSTDAAGTVEHSTEAPAAPVVNEPVVNTPTVNTPTVNEPSVNTPSANTPSAE